MEWNTSVELTRIFTFISFLLWDHLLLLPFILFLIKAELFTVIYSWVLYIQCSITTSTITVNFPIFPSYLLHLPIPPPQPTILFLFLFYIRQCLEFGPTYTFGNYSKCSVRNRCDKWHWAWIGHMQG